MNRLSPRFSPPIAAPLWLCWFAVSVSALLAEDLAVTASFPVGLKSGQPTTIELIPTPKRWPLKVACTQTAIQWKAGEKKGAMVAEVPADMAPRLIWFRVYDDQGASGWIPLLVSDANRIDENEPNDRSSDRKAIALPCAIDGKLGKGGDVDTFSVELAEGDQLVARLWAHWLLNSPIDAVLQVADARGNILTQNHDDRELDPTVVFKATEKGTYQIRLFAFPSMPNSTIGFSGGSSSVYQLELTTGPMLDACVPMVQTQLNNIAPKPRGWNIPQSSTAIDLTATSTNRWQWSGLSGWMGLAPVQLEESKTPVLVLNEPCDKTRPLSISLPVRFTACFEEDRDNDVIQIEVIKGDAIVIKVQSNSLGFLADPTLRILDATNKQVATYDDTKKLPDLDVIWKVPESGKYVFVLEDRFRSGGPRHWYDFSLWKQEPTVKVTVAKDRFEVTAGKKQSIELAISRVAGFDQDLELSIEGLPTGCTSEVVVLPAKEKKAKATLEIVADESRAPGGFEIRIVGKVPGTKSPVFSAASTVAPTFAPASTIWLTVRKP